MDLEVHARPVELHCETDRVARLLMHEHGDAHGEGLAVLGLLDSTGHGEARTVGGCRDVCESESRGPGARRPGLEKGCEIAPARGFERTTQIFEAGDTETVVGPDTRKPGLERLVAELAAQHVKEHGALAVADRLGGRAVTAAELDERKIAAVPDIIGIAFEHLAPIDPALAGALAQQVIGQVGGEPLGPIAGLVVDIDAVAPPVMKDLVRVGGVDDEGQADDLRSEQREGGHAVAGLPEILDQRELGERIVADQPGIEVDVALRRVQIALCQGGVGLAQIDLGLECGVSGPSAVDIALEGCRDQIDIVLRMGLAPGGASACRIARALALRDRGPAVRKRDCERKGLKAVRDARIPAAVAVEEDALGRDGAARPLAGTAHALGDLLARMADRSAVGQGDGTGSGDAKPVAGQMIESFGGVEPRIVRRDVRLHPGVKEQQPFRSVVRKRQRIPHLQGARIGVDTGLDCVLHERCSCRDLCRPEQDRPEK